MVSLKGSLGDRAVITDAAGNINGIFNGVRLVCYLKKLFYFGFQFPMKACSVNTVYNNLAAVNNRQTFIRVKEMCIRDSKTGISRVIPTIAA